MNKTQMLLNEIKNNNGTLGLAELGVFAGLNDIKTYKGLLTKSKNQEMLILENDKYTITQKGIEYIDYNPKAQTNKNKEKRNIVQKTRQQEMYDLQQELIKIFNSENLKMNTLKKNRIVQICNRMIKLDEIAINYTREQEVIKDDNNATIE